MLQKHAAYKVREILWWVINEVVWGTDGAPKDQSSQCVWSEWVTGAMVWGAVFKSPHVSVSLREEREHTSPFWNPCGEAEPDTPTLQAEGPPWQLYTLIKKNTHSLDSSAFVKCKVKGKEMSQRESDTPTEIFVVV